MEKNFNYLSLEYFYAIVLVLFLARPATFFTNLDPRTNLWGFALYILPSVYLFYSHRLTLSTKFLIAIGLYTIWVGIHIINDADFKILSYLLIYAHLFVAYVTIQVYHDQIFRYFWRIVTAITVIDCVLWIAIQFINPESLIPFSFATPAAECSIASFIIFNVPNVWQYEGLGLFGLSRNCGFAWEPGLFGSILVLAVFFNMAERNYKLYNNYALYVLIFGVFSTFSTTAYIALIILFILRIAFSSRKHFTGKHLLGIIALVGIILIINNLPFMNEKIREDLSMEDMVTTSKSTMVNIGKEDKLITVQRTEGIILDFLNFQDAPLWGYGMTMSNSFVSRNISPYIVTSNDLTSFLAKWGIIYSILIITFMIWTSRFIRQFILYDSNSLFTIYLIIAVSYSFSTCALMISFLLYRVFENYEWEETYIEEDNKNEYDYEAISSVIQ